MDIHRTPTATGERQEPLTPVPVQLGLLLAVLFTGAFYLSYAQSAWFFQDDFQLIMQYAHALQPQQLLDFGSFGRLLSRNAYWHYGIKLFALHAPLFFLLNLFFICATSLLVYRIVLRKYGAFPALVAGLVYFCLPGTVEAYSWLSNSQHLLGHLFVMVFVYLFTAHDEGGAGHRQGTARALLLVLVLVLGFLSNVFMGMVLSLPLWMLVTDRNHRRNPWNLGVAVTGMALFLYFYVRLADQQTGAYATSFTAATFWKNATFYFKSDLGAALWICVVLLGAAWSWFKGRLLTAWFFLASAAFMLPFAFLEHQRYGSYAVLMHLFAVLGCWCLACDSCDVQGGIRPQWLPYAGAAVVVLVLMQSLMLPLRHFGQYPHGKAVRDQVEQLRLFAAKNPAVTRYCFRSGKQTVNNTGVKVWDIPAEWWQVGFGAAFALFVDGQKTYELVTPTSRCDATFTFIDQRLEHVAE
jgi:hypothetical protein